MQALQSFGFNLRTKTRFGANISPNLGKYLKEFSFKKIGIVVDPAIVDLPIFKKILKKIEDEHFNTVKIWKYDIGEEPDYDSLDEIKVKFLDNKKESLVDCFVGIGGGSVIDFAKGLATLATNAGPARKYKGFPSDLNLPLPTIAVPTTAGTGSEVTYNAVFIDKKENKKLGINSMHNFPVLAVLDPALTLSCPKSVTVSSGMDALVHTLESYAATQSNSFTKIFAREAFKLIFNNLSKVLDAPQDVNIRGNLLFGSYLAGVSLVNSGSGPTGALSYPLGTYFKVPHGIAGAVFLSHVIKHNIARGYDYSELYDLVENADMSANTTMKNNLFSEKLFELCTSLGVPSTLNMFGVNKENIHILLKETEGLEKAFAQNPVSYSVDDGKELLKQLISV